MKNHKDILLNKNDDLTIANGDFVVSESEMQEVGIILRLAKGELKEDPILGANLIELMHSEKNNNEMLRRAKLNLLRDGKDWRELKDKMQMNPKFL